jgi:hypothetical protein
VLTAGSEDCIEIFRFRVQQENLGESARGCEEAQRSLAKVVRSAQDHRRVKVKLVGEPREEVKGTSTEIDGFSRRCRTGRLSLSQARRWWGGTYVCQVQLEQSNQHGIVTVIRSDHRF